MAYVVVEIYNAEPEITNVKVVGVYSNFDSAMHRMEQEMRKVLEEENDFFKYDPDHSAEDVRTLVWINDETDIAYRWFIEEHEVMN